MFYSAQRNDSRQDLGQCCFFSRNIGLVTPKNYYFHCLSKYTLDQIIFNKINLILKTEALNSITPKKGYDALCPEWVLSAGYDPNEVGILN